MCKAIRDLKRECINKRKKLGREEGEKTGKANALKSFVERLFGMRYCVTDICTLTGAPEKTVQEITLSLQPQT